MQTPRKLETVDINAARNLEELKQLLDKQIRILESNHRKVHNDVSKLRADVDGYHP